MLKRVVYTSQQGEDFFIYRNFINKRVNDGVFIELGACDGLRYSNSYFFEKNLGFRGIMIEPVKEMYDKLVKNRPNNDLYNCVISMSEDDVEILVSQNGPVSGIKSSMTESFKNKWHRNSITRRVKTDTLKRILNDKSITYVDFLSLDVEGGEADVLQTIDWDNIEMYLVCIELDGHNQQKDEVCREILRKAGFVLEARMCINEFWVNPSYLKKDRLYDSSIRDNFSGNFDEYGKHVFMEPHCRQRIRDCINEYEK